MNPSEQIEFFTIDRFASYREGEIRYTINGWKVR
jgi:hypothetical protein